LNHHFLSLADELHLSISAINGKEIDSILFLNIAAFALATDACISPLVEQHLVLDILPPFWVAISSSQCEETVII
jgi:hypothetical protein